MKLATLALLTTLGLGGLGGVAHADPGRGEPHPRGEFRQLLLQHFDRNHDGRLEPEERRHAIQVLRRLTRRLAMQDRNGRMRDGHMRDGRMRNLVRRFDRNGDGVVTPDEMPPGAARRLRSLDRNGDGWVDENDQR